MTEKDTSSSTEKALEKTATQVVQKDKVPPELESNKQGESRTIHHESWIGPIPPPRIIEDYKNIYPEAAKIIFDQFEKEGDNRRKIEKSDSFHTHFKTYVGQLFALIVVLTVTYYGYLIVSAGKDIYGTAAILAPLAGLAGVFMYERHQRTKDKEIDAQIETKKNGDRAEP